MKHWLPIVLALPLFSCAVEDTVVTLNFPVERTFLFSDRAEILVVPVQTDTECPGLVAQALLGDPPTSSIMTDARPICEFRGGSLVVGPQPEGNHAYVALVRDVRGVVILTGCRVREEVRVSEPVNVVLSATQDFFNTYPPTEVPPCPTVEAKCGGGCS